MANNQYSSDKNAMFSFDDDEEIDDETFLRHPVTGPSGYLLGNSNKLNSHEDSLEDRRQQLLQKKKEIEKRSIQSTERSLSYLRNSEEVGIATAEELIRQREQLERTEKRLDDINSTLRFSQKHIQSIKSVFGGLKNLLSGKMNEPVPHSSSSSNRQELESNSRLANLIEEKSSELSKTSTHPGLRIRGLVEDDDDGLTNTQQAIDRNLDEMITSITRLKGLAHGLGEEIESHNDLIENVITKAEKADTSLSRQNKSIKRLLE